MEKFLKFPNARLSMYNLIANSGLSGSEALVQFALESGLLHKCGRAMGDLIAIGEGCQCLSTAKNVFLEHFEGKGEGYSTATTSSALEAWRMIEREYDSYIESRDQSSAIAPEAEGCEVTGCAQACMNCAPVLLDLILQQIRRYT